MRLLGETARETLWQKRYITAASSEGRIYLRFPCLCIYTGEGQWKPSSDHCREPFSSRLPSPEPQSGLICRDSTKGQGCQRLVVWPPSSGRGSHTGGETLGRQGMCLFVGGVRLTLCPWTWLNTLLCCCFQSTLSYPLSVTFNLQNFHLQAWIWERPESLVACICFSARVWLGLYTMEAHE